jgi:hypothetical protein
MQLPKQRSKQQPKQRLLRQQQPKLPKQRQQQPKRQPKLGSQLLELVQVLVQLQHLELEQQQALLLFCKRSEPVPAGRRSAKIFSWVFLN